MKIAILDQDNGRVIVSKVPEYLSNADVSSDDIASAILTALGISTDTEYMIGEFKSVEDSYGMRTSLEGLTQDFKTDALEALEESKD